MEYYLAIKKNGILSFATSWMDLEGIMLCEISQPEKERKKEKNPHDFSYMWNLRNRTSKAETDSYTENK